jgi:excisionase family DNA binding protein
MPDDDLVVMKRSQLAEVIRNVVREELARAGGLSSEPELLSTAELSEKLGIYHKTIAGWTKEGCPHVRAGKGYRWRLADVLRWLKETGRDG